MITGTLDIKGFVPFGEPILSTVTIGRNSDGDHFFNITDYRGNNYFASNSDLSELLKSWYINASNLGRGFGTFDIFTKYETEYPVEYSSADSFTPPDFQV